MIAVPDQILEKSTPLSPEESVQIQEHCRIGKDLLAVYSPGPCSRLRVHHHERIDGSGYPAGLAVPDIP